MNESSPQRFRVLDEESAREVWFDATDSKKWDSDSYGEHWDPADGFPRFTVTETLYRHPSGFWTLIVERCHFDLGNADPQARRLRDEEAAQWLVKNGHQLPEDFSCFSQLEQDSNFQPGEPALEQRVDTGEFTKQVIDAIDPFEPSSDELFRVSSQYGSLYPDSLEGDDGNPVVAAARKEFQVESIESTRCQQLIPTPLQVSILDALENRALKKEPLASECKVDSSRLYRPGGLKELRAQGLVKHQRNVGFFRPDAPPPNSIPLVPGEDTCNQSAPNRPPTSP